MRVFDQAIYETHGNELRYSLFLAQYCQTLSECNIWVWINDSNQNEFWYHRCFLKSSNSGGSFHRDGWISGVRNCQGKLISNTLSFIPKHSAAPLAFDLGKLPNLLS